jgi:cytochrome P450
MSRLGEKSGQLDHIDMAAECLDHMVAGIDTTGDTLCFLMWELSQPRSLHLQRRLTEELQKNPEAGIDQLPFLDAVLCEGLRYYPAIPMSLPRLVPPGGRSIDGFHLPEKTIVSCQAHSVHRINTEVFPNPDKFHPDRWLEAEGDADRRRLLFAFSNGGRGCVGKQYVVTQNLGYSWLAVLDADMDIPVLPLQR